MISRNLTIDKHGLPEGHTFSVTILRTGRDFDSAPPNYATNPATLPNSTETYPAWRSSAAVPLTIQSVRLPF